MKTEGFKTEQPIIDRISFRKQGYLSLFLEDGRILYVPLSRFPSIARLNGHQRKQYHIADGTVLMFADDDNVYPIQEFIGTNTSQPGHLVSYKAVLAA